MPIPLPTEQQGRILWFSVTALAVAVLLALLGGLLWATGWVLNLLSSVLLPLAAAAILSYLLDPVVDFIERKGIPRTRAILLVFFLVVMLGLTLAATVVPQLIFEVQSLADDLPAHTERLQKWFGQKLSDSPLGMKAKAAWDGGAGETARGWVTAALPAVSTWLVAQFTKVASWFGLIVGFALVPVYTFYFLLEKAGIQGSWTKYLPLRESQLKEEVVFVLTAINDHLIVFFRGQILVAMCSGALLTAGFLMLGLPYAVLLGVLAGLLGIVPYLGVAISLVPAIALAVVQFGDWLHPLLVLALFALVQAVEGLFISPKIIGDRVGLHPLTIIIAVMLGTTLLGGVLGGILAIPLTAALRVLMYRYVWKGKPAPANR